MTHIATISAAASSPHSPGASSRSRCLKFCYVVGLETAKNTLEAAIPIINIIAFKNLVTHAGRNYADWETATKKNELIHASFYKEQYENTVMRAVAAFMVAAGSTLLLVGLYYYMASDYTLANKLFMAGGIATGVGCLLFFSACYRSILEM